jgi:hypothetical protein
MRYTASPVHRAHPTSAIYPFLGWSQGDGMARREYLDYDGQRGAGEQKLQDSSRKVTSNHQQLESKKIGLRKVETDKAAAHKAVWRLLSPCERLPLLLALACTRPSWFACAEVHARSARPPLSLRRHVMVGQIKDFRSMERIRMEALHNAESVTYQAAQWLSQNKDRFEHDVIGPLCTTISVRDRESAAMIEAALGKDKLTFIVQSDRDYDTFYRIQSQPGHPLKSATCVRWLGSNVDPSRIDGVAAGKLAEYGIDGTLMDRSVNGLQMVKGAAC